MAHKSYDTLLRYFYGAFRVFWILKACSKSPLVGKTDDEKIAWSWGWVNLDLLYFGWSIPLIFYSFSTTFKEAFCIFYQVNISWSFALAVKITKSASSIVSFLFQFNWINSPHALSLATRISHKSSPRPRKVPCWWRHAHCLWLEFIILCKFFTPK